jgi:hypothetical protein
MNMILIEFNEFTIKARLNDNPTSKEIWDQLPIDGQVNTWGDEIYFEIDVTMPQEPDAREQVEVGELGYWPVGRAFCIFFGPTPVSTDEQPRAYSPVNIIGEVIGDTAKLKTIKDGENVRIGRVVAE